MTDYQRNNIVLSTFFIVLFAVIFAVMGLPIIWATIFFAIFVGVQIFAARKIK